jgi:hypothetical protein
MVLRQPAHRQGAGALARNSYPWRCSGGVQRHRGTHKSLASYFAPDDSFQPAPPIAARRGPAVRRIRGILLIRPAFAHRVTVFGSTRKRVATSPGVSSRSRASTSHPRHIPSQNQSKIVLINRTWADGYCLLVRSGEGRERASDDRAAAEERAARAEQLRGQAEADTAAARQHATAVRADAEAARADAVEARREAEEHRAAAAGDLSRAGGEYGADAGRGAGRPGPGRPSRRVTYQPPTSGGDLPDRRGGHGREPGVVVPATGLFRRRRTGATPPWWSAARARQHRAVGCSPVVTLRVGVEDAERHIVVIRRSSSSVPTPSERGGRTDVSCVVSVGGCRCRGTVAAEWSRAVARVAARSIGAARSRSGAAVRRRGGPTPSRSERRCRGMPRCGGPVAR